MFERHIASGTLRWALGLWILAGATLPAFGETTVWLRDGAPGAVKRITRAEDGSSGTIRLTIAGHGFSSGDKINVDGVGGCYRANGTRTVFAVADSNTVEVKGRDGQDLDCGGNYRPPNAAGTMGARYYTAAKLNPYTLKDPPNVNGLDGPSGGLTTALQSRRKTGNPAYDAMKVRTDALLGSGGNPYTASPVPTNVGAVLGAAMLWHAHGRSTCSGGEIKTRGNGSRFCTNDSTWEYLDMTRWWINHAEAIGRGPGCDESIRNCARSGLQNSIDQNSPSLAAYPAAYSLIYDQLTDEERSAFSNKFLNNVRMNHSSEAGCANQYVKQAGSRLAGTNGNRFVTITPPEAAASATVGHQIRWNTGNGNGSISDVTYTVTGIDAGAGRIDLDRPVADGSTTSTSWYTVAPFDPATHCGFVWFEGHFDINALWTRDAYPPAGGNAYSWNSNLTWWRVDAYAAIGAATCPSDVRGCELFERAQAFYYDQMMNHAKNLWTGFTQGGSSYYQGRVQGVAASLVQTLKGGLTPPLDTSGGVWLTRTLLRQIYDNLPGASNGNHFHSWGETSVRTMNAYEMNHFQYGIGAVADTEEAARARHWLFHRFPLYTNAGLQFGGGIFAPWSFLNVDPNATRSEYTALPPQYVFQQTDLETVPQNYLGAYSKTGWTNSDTSILMLAGGSWEDHWQFRSPGSYQIFNGNYLYADDRGASIGACGSSASCFSAENENSSSILIGEPNSATATQHVTWADAKFDPIGPVQGSYIEMKRWAGTNPTGRADNRYTYFAYDAYRAANTATIGTKVNRAWHHYLHLKANGRDYLLRYVDIGLTAPRRVRGFLHFPNNGGAGEGATAMDASGTIYTTTNSGTSMHTRVLVPDNAPMTTVDVVRNGDTLVVNTGASSQQPYRHRSGGLNCEFRSPSRIKLAPGSPGTAYVSVTPSCEITVNHTGLAFAELTGLLQELGVAGANFLSGADPIISWGATASGWNSQGYLKGGLPNKGPNNYRVVVDLGQDVNAEYLVLHDIHGNKSNGTENPGRVINSSESWYTVQIDGALPAVAAFGRRGRCYSQWGAATSHADNALYVVAGLCPGMYSIRHNGQQAATLEVHVGDESASWEGTAGNWETIAINPKLGVAGGSLPFGAVGSPYYFELPVDGGIGPYFWSVISGALPDGLDLSPQGVLTGVPLREQTASFEVAVRDSSEQQITGQGKFDIAVAVVDPILLSLDVTSLQARQAAVSYGSPRLPEEARCLLRLYEAAADRLVDVYEDNGGPQLREYTWGTVNELTPDTPYKVTAICGEATAETLFTTAAS